MVSLALQHDAALGGALSVLTRQKRDHVRLDRLLRRLDETAGHEQDQTLRRIYRLVFPHAFAEEAVLWPVIRHTLPDGEALTRRVEQEHQEVNELVRRLEGEGLEAGQRATQLSRLTAVLREDVRDEEDALLPALQERLTKPQLRLLGVIWELIRRTAPTRPHPMVSRRPPGNVLAAAPLTVLDNIRDLCDVAFHRAPGPMPRKGLRAASRLATRCANRVETLNFARRGEPPTTTRQPDE